MNYSIFTLVQGMQINSQKLYKCYYTAIYKSEQIIQIANIWLGYITMIMLMNTLSVRNLSR